MVTPLTLKPLMLFGFSAASLSSYTNAYTYTQMFDYKPRDHVSERDGVLTLAKKSCLKSQNVI